MKIKSLLVLSVLLPFMLCCSSKEEIMDLPEPSAVNTELADESDEYDGEEVESSGRMSAPSSGNGWRVFKIHKGVMYYTFSGTDAITGAKQQAFAIDVDLSSKYTVKMTYTTPSLATSAAHQMYSSVATMNAGYETGSIYIRDNGQELFNIPNTTIGTSGVPNWKSEAAFIRKSNGTISIKKGATLTRPYAVPANINTAITTLRNAYHNATAEDLISSAPMLIDNYSTVGETFVNESISNWQNLNGENPQKHQRARHPRSAIALTADNHFIMLVVDGRNPGVSEGMNAKELTKFLKKWFNPQYALNMDGGGSSTLCVEGKGNSQTHVVNTPCNDNGAERKRLTHFIVVPK
ncbi:MAG: phosphodiester glycosidase family protein [Bacteroidales bacterium]|nr:phosphodiester glycosidase family protein [Bacteroidales bacterium]